MTIINKTSLLKKLLVQLFQKDINKTNFIDCISKAQSTANQLRVTLNSFDEFCRLILLQCYDRAESALKTCSTIRGRYSCFPQDVNDLKAKLLLPDIAIATKSSAGFAESKFEKIIDLNTLFSKAINYLVNDNRKEYTSILSKCQDNAKNMRETSGNISDIMQAIRLESLFAFLQDVSLSPDNSTETLLEQTFICVCLYLNAAKRYAELNYSKSVYQEIIQSPQLTTNTQPSITHIIHQHNTQISQIRKNLAAVVTQQQFDAFTDDYDKKVQQLQKDITKLEQNIQKATGEISITYKKLLANIKSEFAELRSEITAKKKELTQPSMSLTTNNMPRIQLESVKNSSSQPQPQPQPPSPATTAPTQPNPYSNGRPSFWRTLCCCFNQETEEERRLLPNGFQN